MPAFFFELFSEEIPARMQARAAEDLARLFSEACAGLNPTQIRTFFAPRRVALAAEIAAEIPATSSIERGPRINAPEAALAGFLRKHAATREDLRQEGDFWVLEKSKPAAAAPEILAATLPALLRRFPWPKSMRWGGTSNFTWVRPLRRILCTLDGEIVPFTLAEGEDDGHGLAASNLTEGHRFLKPGAFPAPTLQAWQHGLQEARVIVDAEARARIIAEGIAARAAEAGVEIVEDPGLIAEVAGLTEWPVALRGQIDAAFMDLPAEVMQVSMRVNQRYFATRTADGKAAPYFIFAANVEAPDQGAAIIAGNERVLRARFADARHFWDLDRKTPLAARVEALGGVTFHAKLGTQLQRARRLESLSRHLAPACFANPDLAARAGLLAKADLTTGMVGEFPELQGVMGGYYATHDGEAAEIAAAITQHYQPKGASDALPEGAVATAVALADKFDQLAGFFSVGEKPTGSGDPYALRRAALGIFRIIRAQNLRLDLRAILSAAITAQNNAPDAATIAEEIQAFLLERIKIQLKGEGARADIFGACVQIAGGNDITGLLARTSAVTALLATEDGKNLCAAYKRAANILRIEERKDGPHAGPINPTLLSDPAEQSLAAALDACAATETLIAAENFADAASSLAALRAPLDAFFTSVTVNAENPDLRANRLRLLASLRAAMQLLADFSEIDA